jgi:hypothetical protein
MSVKLLRHWTPDPEIKVIIVGYKKAAVLARLATGGTQVLEPERFVANEMAPPPVPAAINISSSTEKGKFIEWTKIWAGTYVEVDADVAYDLIEKGAAQVVRPG